MTHVSGIDAGPAEETVVDETPATSTMAKKRFWQRSRSQWITFAIGAVLGIVVLAVGILAGRVYTYMSPYDEAAHFDYVNKIVAEKSIPLSGQPLSQSTVDEISCRGIVWLPNPTCEHFLPSDTPLHGLNYVLTYVPVYHVATALVAGPLSALSGMSLFLASRAASSLFLAIGAVLMFRVLLRLGTNRWLAAGGVLLLVAPPIVIFQGSTVSPDSTMLIAAALALFPLVSRLRWSERIWLGIGIAVFISLLKASYMPVSVIVVLLAGFAPLRDRPNEVQGRWVGTTAKRFWLTGLATALPVAAQFGGSRIRESMAVSSAGTSQLNDLLTTKESFLQVLVDAAKVLIRPFDSAALPNSMLLGLAGTVLGVAIFGGSLFLSGSRWGTDRTLALTSLVGIVGFAVAVVMLPSIFYFTAHTIGTQGRYSVPIAMILAVPLLASIKAKPAQWIVGLAGAGFFLATAVKIYSEHPW